MKSVDSKKLAYCFLVSNEGRDFHILLPIVYFLERFRNFEIEFKFVWQAHCIYFNPPDLVIVPNIRGNNMYYEVAKYAYDNDILVYYHDSEGNFNTKTDFDWWGYNLVKKFLCPVQYAWNERVQKYVEHKYHFPPGTFKISGGVGFDRYQYLPDANRTEILKAFNKEGYKKVVGYAGWAFGKLHNKEFSDLSIVSEWGEGKARLWIEAQRDFVRDVLSFAIKNNPDVLFILKKHPRENFESDNRDSPNEMNVFLDCPNVLYLKNEVPIHELIKISDVWTSYESTSAMEAWLIGVPTVCIKNDQSLEYKWSSIYEGSLMASTPEEFSNKLSLLFDGESEDDLLSIEQKQKRHAIISDSIGYSDGLNHLRALKYFLPYLSQNSRVRRPRVNFKFIRLMVLLKVGVFLYPFFPLLFKKIHVLNKHIWMFKEYRLLEVKKEKERYYGCLDDYYLRLGINSESQALSLIE